MHVLVVYYSLEGNTRFIAKEIAQATPSEILELQPLQSIPTKGLLKYFMGGKAAITKSAPPLNPLSRNPQEFDLLFLGTPVWGWNHAPAFNTFFAKYPFFGKDVALFCCHGGGKGAIFSKMEAALPKGNQLMGCIDFQEPLKRDSATAASKVRNWAREIVEKAERDTI